VFFFAFEREDAKIRRPDSLQNLRKKNALTDVGKQKNRKATEQIPFAAEPRCFDG